jgi:hypothetical protein
MFPVFVEHTKESQRTCPKVDSIQPQQSLLDLIGRTSEILAQARGRYCCHSLGVEK